MSISAAGRTVPVVWKPSDLTGLDSDGHYGRSHPILAAVHHRVVGTLESMTNSTFDPIAGKDRRVSSHFGIGFWGDELRIVQYVALENTAYCNGQKAADVLALTGAKPWRIYSEVRRAAGKHISANEFTYSIEHEDNALPGAYVVREEIIAASIALDRLLLSGDGPAIRAAGIRCTDATAAELGRLVPSPDTIVDHNYAAPASKPFCWRPVPNGGRDPGFPQARYIAALSGAPAPKEDTVLPFYVYETPRRVELKPGVWLYDNSALQPSPGNRQITPPRPLIHQGTWRDFIGVAYEPATPDADASSLVYFVKTDDVARITPVPPPTAPAADCTAAVKTAVAADRAKAKVTWP